mmetsp:Transcript_81923/g.163130  ORF Transcript_81923/g.163130 Transcript_81923/m.163130 type:complete len:241 (-) Transcript_81923:143-865(-)|eukprot:CAMPEP_0174751340 /NCGR_PEP_ID=MMETSP1094-20130205/99612_1 /TAXON_ID=156173 /ORGANISM="Chrysochromulina brevifilum, Strain UTEX LB 985" /LENGTH=240 /DNA_ID=CAMNT_0015956815 /DNA_START=31 /DNA_END=753 /DNA_ORIENTATION=+
MQVLCLDADHIVTLALDGAIQSRVSIPPYFDFSFCGVGAALPPSGGCLTIDAYGRLLILRSTTALEVFSPQGVLLQRLAVQERVPLEAQSRNVGGAGSVTERKAPSAFESWAQKRLDELWTTPLAWDTNRIARGVEPLPPGWSPRWSDVVRPVIPPNPRYQEIKRQIEHEWIRLEAGEKEQLQEAADALQQEVEQRQKEQRQKDQPISKAVLSGSICVAGQRAYVMDAQNAMVRSFNLLG